MHDSVPDRRVGCKRARAGAGAITMRALLLVLLAAGPHVPCSDALKLASISEDRGHLGVGLLRAVEVVRGRYERAWALISAAEPTAEELETALELLQVGAAVSVFMFHFCIVFCIRFFCRGPHHTHVYACAVVRPIRRVAPEGATADSNLVCSWGKRAVCVATVNDKLRRAPRGVRNESSPTVS